MRADGASPENENRTGSVAMESAAVNTIPPVEMLYVAHDESVTIPLVADIENGAVVVEVPIVSWLPEGTEMILKDTENATAFSVPLEIAIVPPTTRFPLVAPDDIVYVPVPAKVTLPENSWVRLLSKCMVLLEEALNVIGVPKDQEADVELFVQEPLTVHEPEDEDVM